MATERKRRAPGEGGAYEYETRAGTRWYFKCTVTAADGARRPVVRRGFESRPAALKEMRKVLAASDAGTFADPGKVTVGEWLAEWLAGVRVAEGSRRGYGNAVRLAIAPRLGALPLAKLTSARINAFYRELEAHGSQRGGPLAPRSVRFVHAVLHQGLQAAVDAEPPLLAKNPAAKAAPPKVSDDGTKTKAWTPEQVAAFLAWAAEHDAERAALWRFAFTTGLRRGELIGLQWGDVSGGVLSVRRSARPGPTGLAVVGPVKNRKARAVALDEATVKLLRAWKAQRGGLALALVRHDAPVFGGPNGERPRPGNVSAAFERAVARFRRDLGDAAPPRITLHGTRHTMITAWLTAGVPVKVVAERAGHTVQTMLSAYSHLLADSQAGVVERMAELLTAPSGDAGAVA